VRYDGSPATLGSAVRVEYVTLRAQARELAIARNKALAEATQAYLGYEEGIAWDGTHSVLVAYACASVV